MSKLLVVEDDFDTLHPLAELLRLKGHNVFTAVDAEQALLLASQQTPDVIITDIALPGKSGLHFINRVRRDTRLGKVPIIVISGCGPAVMVEAEAAGANFCIEKPISLDLFWEAINLSVGTASPDLAKVDFDTGMESDDPTVSSIDRLVIALRSCNSRAERDRILGELKQSILKLHRRNGELT
jgi:two-component system phosphate regulon response regulator PhoB